MTAGQRSCYDEAFSLVELMVVVLIIGVLVAIAIPVFSSSARTAEERTCFSNQRIVESSAQTWASDHGEDLTPLAGVVDGSHDLVHDYVFRVPPRCPSAPEPADVMTIDVAHGAYTLDNDGNVAACGHGTPAHGRFR